MTSRTSKKAARQNAAEMRREAEQRERRRQRLTTAAILGGAAVLGAAVLVAAILARSGDGGDEIAYVDQLADVSGLGTEAQPPWPAPTDVPARTELAGLGLGPMGTAEHYHAHLDVIVNGEPVEVPANIGVDAASGAMTYLHTHETDGIIHIEAAEEGQDFTLGQLFTEWDVRLTQNQLGGLEADNGNTLAVYVDGEKVSGNPALLKLAEHQEIAVVYGPADQDVDIPDSYDFPPGV